MQKVHIGYRKLNTDILGIFLTYLGIFLLANTLLTYAKEGKKKKKKKDSQGLGGSIRRIYHLPVPPMNQKLPVPKRKKKHVNLGIGSCRLGQCEDYRAP